jgi:Na+-translocating ferredoxin:NAD+ oxidoreductase RnfE subunit
MLYRIKLQIGLLLSIVPVYVFLAWLYVFIEYDALNHQGKVVEFLSFFPSFLQNASAINWLSMFLALISVLMLANTRLLKEKFKIAWAVYITILSLILAFNIWSVL